MNKGRFLKTKIVVWFEDVCSAKRYKSARTMRFPSFAQKTALKTRHEYRSARTEISPVVGPVGPQHHPTDQHVGVQRGRELAAAVHENQASLVELHRCFIARSSGITTSLERIDVLQKESRLSVD